MEKQTIIIIGSQGSGKGTQAKLLIEHLETISTNDCHYIETGQIFRDLVETSSHTAKLIKTEMESGKLLPNWLTFSLVTRELIERITDSSHLFFDGFPRNLSQAGSLDKLLNFYNRNNLKIIKIDLSEEVAKERMLNRGRADDSPETISQRLKAYKEKTIPIIDYYQNRADTEFITINGDNTIEDVSDQIKQKLGL